MTLPTVESVEPLELVPAAPRRHELFSLIPAGILLILSMIWILADGGYGTDMWYPSVLIAGALALAVAYGGSRWLPASRIARVALLAFAALVALNYLSILWAGSPGSALDGSNKLLLYAAVAWVFAVLPWTPRTLAAGIGLWSVGVFVCVAIGLIRATSAVSLDPFFVSQRYAIPMHYPNATAALAVMGMWPALLLCARRELPFWLRAPLLAVAVFLGDVALLPQSRGALLGLLLSAPVALIVSSDRFRLICRMAVVGAAMAICLSHTIAVDHAIDAGRHVAPLLDRAAETMLDTSLVALGVGAIFALVEDRFSWRPGWVRRRARRRQERTPGLPGLNLSRGAKLGLAAVLVIVLAGGALAAEPPVVHAVNSVISQGHEDASTGSTRLFSATPEERLDYARVALHLFSTAPILGIGSGNFGRRYDPLRRFQKHSQYTHNLALRVLSETGIVGIVLLFAMICAIVSGLLVVARRVPDLGRVCAVTALTVAAFFLVHDSLDWLDQYPALAAPAIAFPMAALTLQRRALASSLAEGRSSGSPPEDRTSSRRMGSSRGGRNAPAIAVVAASIVLALVVGAPYLSKIYINRAFATYGSHPGSAFHDLRVAQSLDPLSVDPITSQGTIALYMGKAARSEAAFEQAIRKEDDWYPRLELALLEAQSGRFTAASAELRAAAKLDADDPVLAQAMMMVSRHQRLDPEDFNQLLLQGQQSVFFQPAGIN